MMKQLLEAEGTAYELDRARNCYRDEIKADKNGKNKRGARS